MTKPWRVPKSFHTYLSSELVLQLLLSSEEGVKWREKQQFPKVVKEKESEGVIFRLLGMHSAAICLRWKISHPLWPGS
jgi:hypothetical protein